MVSIGLRLSQFRQNLVLEWNEKGILVYQKVCIHENILITSLDLIRRDLELLGEAPNIMFKHLTSRHGHVTSSGWIFSQLFSKSVWHFKPPPPLPPPASYVPANTSDSASCPVSQKTNICLWMSTAVGRPVGEITASCKSVAPSGGTDWCSSAGVTAGWSSDLTWGVIRVHLLLNTSQMLSSSSQVQF